MNGRVTLDATNGRFHGHLTCCEGATLVLPCYLRADDRTSSTLPQRVLTASSVLNGVQFLAGSVLNGVRSLAVRWRTQNIRIWTQHLAVAGFSFGYAIGREYVLNICIMLNFISQISRDLKTLPSFKPSGCDTYKITNVIQSIVLEAIVSVRPHH